MNTTGFPFAASFVLGCLLAVPGRAQTPASPPASALAGQPTPAGPWTLQAAVDYALAHNLSVRQSELTAQQQEATQRLQRAALLPTAGLNGSQTFSFGTNKDPFTNQFQAVNVRGNNFTASAQVTLFSGFQLRNTVKQGVLDAEAARVDIVKARNDLSLNVASSFLQLLLAQELIRASEARLSTVREQVSRSEKLLRAGAVAEGNVLDSRAQLAGEERTLVTAQNQRDLAQLALVQQLNLDPAGAARFQVVAPVLPDPTAFAAATGQDMDPNATFELARQNLPEIKAADLRVQSARRGIDIARGAYYPRLTMAGGVQTGYSSVRTQQLRVTGEPIAVPVLQVNPTAPGGYSPSPYVLLSPQTTFQQLPYNFFDQLADNRGEFLQFSLNIPIVNGLQSRVGVQRAQVNVQQVELRAEQTRLQVRQSIQQAYADALAAQRRFAASSRQVEALSLAFRNAEIRFNNGLLNGTDFNIARNNLTAAESDMIQAKYEFFFRRKVLDFYQGKPLSL
ncbi:TolC family protein [Hymenobacter sp. BT770]|uniref:TolC family protein n=1 Tax=Hymenobacter sp. BT770 TaxID=2886942 RepID=UPI001D12F6DC|nr:TolC family protein [Hymenobacter sp. BT770]MCC3152960.1 TolC family protein [Hymenobacter sp. BT770]MDO3415126.1 TolC family protein [Hymenobacter sp. BT770]